MQQRRGFTLVEILIVVVILGILAAVVVPQFASASQQASAASFAKSCKSMADAIDWYRARTGLYPPDGGSGSLPDELEEYINRGEYEGGGLLGGVWDIEQNDSGVTLAVGIHFQDGSWPGDEFMLDIDVQIDDGAFDTGQFRRLADDRYYYVMID